MVDRSMSEEEVLSRLSSLRQHRWQGRRSPHKPLLVLLALGRLTTTGTSEVPWSMAGKLAELIRDFGPPSATQPAQSAAYPFTRLRSDGIWVLDHDVPMDRVQPLAAHGVVGRLAPPVEDALRDAGIAAAAARRLVESEFPPTVAPDVLAAVGLDPDAVLGSHGGTAVRRRRSGSWPATVLEAWDRQCAFCGFDGQLGAATVGVEAAHVRWFTFGGPDDPDNGLALCSLHHKLFDRGVLGLGDDLRIAVSARFTSRTTTGRSVYDLHDRPLRPRPGTPVPAAAHVAWHTREVFKGPALTA
ncbi:phosphorothioated DNA-binding restriction endonuclease [Saccharothrix australiensis]|uniref:phosphorothioated DNA-binding restriction endonuclease n=1 Tax=Saccharothrix australiensis TaxID=2072 RepID=UPI001B86CBEA|nr:HNH endonuclease [Saccharothrix australiensis]